MHFKTKFLSFSIILAALVLLSCSKQSSWRNDEIYSEHKEHRSTKLCYLSKDSAHGIDLEFVQTQELLKVYLNVHSMPVPPYQGDPKSAMVKFTIGSKQTRCLAYRLAGGQRFLLPDEIVETLIQALKEGHPVAISLSGYQSVVKAEDFSSKFDRFQHPFPIKNPFHLPL